MSFVKCQFAYANMFVYSLTFTNNYAIIQTNK